MKVYLCGPINGCTDEECKDWREEMKAHLGPSCCIDPMRRDYRGQEAQAFRQIVELDKLDVLEADAILVNYDRPSVGTSMEVLYAWMHHKPVVIVHPEGANISPWLRYHATHFATSFRDARRVLDALKVAA